LALVQPYEELTVQAGRNRTAPSSLENALVALALAPTRKNIRTTLLLLEEKEETRIQAGALHVLKDAINLSISHLTKALESQHQLFVNNVDTKVKDAYRTVQ
jgi:hypothetical protein